MYATEEFHAVEVRAEQGIYSQNAVLKVRGRRRVHEWKYIVYRDRISAPLQTVPSRVQHFKKKSVLNLPPPTHRE